MAYRGYKYTLYVVSPPDPLTVFLYSALFFRDRSRDEMMRLIQ